MSKKQQDASLVDFMAMVDISIKSERLHLDYSDFKDYCKRKGLSSYILNLIIRRIKEPGANNSGVIDKSYFVLDPDKQPDSKLLKMLKGQRESIEYISHTCYMKECELKKYKRICLCLALLLAVLFVGIAVVIIARL